MLDQLKIATSTWFAGMLFAYPALLVVGFAVFDLGADSARRPGINGLVVVFAVSILISMVLTEMIAGVASNLCVRNVEPGPTVIGFAAGFLSSVVITTAQDRAFVTLLAWGCAPMAGALAGTTVKIRTSALAVGVTVAVLTIMSFTVSSALR